MGDIKRRKFGKTGLMVTELSFGAMNLRLLDNQEQAFEILDYVLGSGVNLIDTARVYNGTLKDGTIIESEVLVGQAIRNRKKSNEPLIIVAKGHGYTPEAFKEDLFLSLKKLGVTGKHELKIGDTDIKLVYFFHGIKDDRWDEMNSSGAMKTAVEFKKAGYFNYLGFSSHYTQEKEIRAAIKTGIFDVIELPYNIINRINGEPEDDNLLKLAYDNDIGVINMKAFGGNGTQPLLDILKDDITLDQRKMLRFCISNPYISTVDAGAKYISEFKDDINAVKEGPILKEDIAGYIKEADKISDLFKDYCRDCRHCLEKFECVSGIDFPTVLVLHERYIISKALGHDVSHIIMEYAKLLENGDDCIECGKCMDWCEYDLKIPGMMKRAHEELSQNQKISKF